MVSKKRIVNPIRDDGPGDHIIKKIGTPTMGGFTHINWYYLDSSYVVRP